MRGRSYIIQRMTRNSLIFDVLFVHIFGSLNESSLKICEDLVQYNTKGLSQLSKKLYRFTTYQNARRVRLVDI